MHSTHTDRPHHTRKWPHALDALQLALQLKHEEGHCVGGKEVRQVEGDGRKGNLQKHEGKREVGGEHANARRTTGGYHTRWGRQAMARLVVWFAVVLVAAAEGRMPPPGEMARSTGVGGKQVSSASASSSALNMNGATDPTNGVSGGESKKKGVVVGQMRTPPHAAPGTTIRFKQEYAAASSKKGAVNGARNGDAIQGGAGGCDMCGANSPCPLNCNPPVTGPRAGAGMRFKAATSESASTSGTPYTKALQGTKFRFDASELLASTSEHQKQGTKAFRFAHQGTERSQSGYKSTYNAKSGSTTMKSGGGGGMMGGGSMKGGMMGGGMMGGMGMGGGFANPYPQYTYNMGYMFNQQWRRQIPWQRQQQGLGAYP